jgi:hypothetical protein
MNAAEPLLRRFWFRRPEAAKNVNFVLEPVWEVLMKPTAWNPPLPALVWDKYGWSGKDKLPAWQGFQSREGEYAAQSSSNQSDGGVQLNVMPPNGVDESPPSNEQAAAYHELLANQEFVRDAILKAVFDSYPAWQAMYGYSGDEADGLMPPVTAPEYFRRLVGLSTVHILPVAKNGIAYVGFEFGCSWDSEHGLGAMTHQGRIVKIGGADTSFLEWVAENDAEG